MTDLQLPMKISSSQENINYDCVNEWIIKIFSCQNMEELILSLYKLYKLGIYQAFLNQLKFLSFQ